MALIVLLLTSNSWVTNYFLKSLEWQNLPLENIPKSEAIDNLLEGEINEQNLAELARLLIRYQNFSGAKAIKKD